MISMNDRIRMLRPYPFHPNKEQKLKPEYVRWFDQENNLRARPLDHDELIRALVKMGLSIKDARLAVKTKSHAQKGDKAVWLACGTDPLVEQIISAMLAEIDKHQLGVMTRYPNDILVADRNFLMMRVGPGAQFAWTVSDSSSHITMLGVDQESNEAVGYVLNNSSSQRFYHLKVDVGSFKLVELSRDDFAALEKTKISYSCGGPFREGTNTIYKGKDRIGCITIRREGAFEGGSWHVDYHPVEGCGVNDLAALSVYGQRIAVHCAHSVFVSTVDHWFDRTEEMLRAA